jgi:hypothetical protein
MTKTVSENTVEHKSKLANRAYLDNRGNIRAETKAARSYSSRLASKHRTKTLLVGMLKTLGETELVDRMTLCGSKFVALTCGSHIVGRRPNHRCDWRLCPFCAVRRSRKLINKYLPLATAFVGSRRVAPVLLTLTQSHRAGELLATSRQRLLDSFKKLSRRGFFERQFAGGLYAVETTIGTDGAWHCHLHIIGFRLRFFDIGILRSEWLTVTGDSHILRLDRVDDLSSGMRECLKYISKPLDAGTFDASHIRQFLKIKGARMFATFGEFAKFCRNYDPSDNVAGEPVKRAALCAGDACPYCSEPLRETKLMTVNKLIAFAREIEARTIPKSKPMELKL